MRVEDLRLGDPLAVVVEVLEALAAPPAADPGARAVDSSQACHRDLTVPADGAPQSAGRQNSRASARRARRCAPAATRERMSRSSGAVAAPGNATAPAASRTISCAAGGVDRADRAQRRSSRRSARPPRSRASAPPSRARRSAVRLEAGERVAPARRAARGAPTRCRGSRAGPARAGPAARPPGRRPRRARPTTPLAGCPPAGASSAISRSRRRPCVARRRPRSTCSTNGRPRLAFSEPSIGSITTRVGPPPLIATLAALLGDRGQRQAERLELGEDRVLRRAVDHVASCRRPRRGPSRSERSARVG